MINCPFHNDNKCSAGVNPYDGFFNCFACNLQLQSKEFIRKYLTLSNPNIDKELLEHQVDCILKGENIMDNKVEIYANQLSNNPIKQFEILSLGISPDVIEQTQLGDNNKATIELPFVLGDNLLGYVYYTPTPKNFAMSKGMKNGYVAPFNLWVNDNSPTLICEGIKDMLIARTYGFNAITLNGGCKSKIHKLFLPYFTNREVIIAYDNDEAGINGAKQLAVQLYDYGVKNIKVLTNWYETLNQDKEDLYDFFTKYNKSANDLINYINDTPYISNKEIETFKDSISAKKLTLLEAVEVPNKKLFRSSIQVKTIPNNAPHKVPATMIWKGLIVLDKTDSFSAVDFQVQFDLTEFKFAPILFSWIEGGAKKEKAICKLLLEYLLKKEFNNELIEAFSEHQEHLKQYGFDDIESFIYSKFIKEFPKTSFHSNEISINFSTTNFTTIYTSTIGDYIESGVDEINSNLSLEFKTYSTTPLITSKIYTIEYELIPNEFDKSINVVLVKSAQESDSLQNFELNQDIKNSLTKFRLPFTSFDNINIKLNELFSNVRDGKIKKLNGERFNSINHLNFNLWLLNELVFNSCLAFKLNNKQHRGVVYANVIGDTRVGKSEIVEQLISIYQKGIKVDAKNSTLLSLVGGSAGTHNEFIRAGVFPRNNGGLVAIEELHGLGQDYFKQTTEIKSSGQVKIQRVSGDLHLQCMVRIIEISNPISNSNVKGVSSFANGAEIIQALIKTPEDIARNDIYFIIGQSDNVSPIQPQVDERLLWEQQTYIDKLKWVWSRKSNNILFQDANYIYDKVNQVFGENFTCPNLPLLGTEGYIKVAKLSIALALLLANYDESFENVVVENSHIDYICAWLKQLYVSSPMLIETYISNENKYINYTQQDIEDFQTKYWSQGAGPNMFKIIADTLNIQSNISKDDLAYKLGCKTNDLGQHIQPFATNFLVQMNNSTNLITSTTKFRKLINLIKGGV